MDAMILSKYLAPERQTASQPFRREVNLPVWEV